MRYCDVRGRIAYRRKRRAGHAEARAVSVVRSARPAQARHAHRLRTLVDARPLRMAWASTRSTPAASGAAELTALQARRRRAEFVSDQVGSQAAGREGSRLTASQERRRSRSSKAWLSFSLVVDESRTRTHAAHRRHARCARVSFHSRAIEAREERIGALQLRCRPRSGACASRAAARARRLRRRRSQRARRRRRCAIAVIERAHDSLAGKRRRVAARHAQDCAGPAAARPIASAVLRPISTGLPSVSALKRFRSSGRCHGIAPSRPIAIVAVERDDQADLAHAASDRFTRRPAP